MPLLLSVQKKFYIRFVDFNILIQSFSNSQSNFKGRRIVYQRNVELTMMLGSMEVVRGLSLQVLKEARIEKRDGFLPSLEEDDDEDVNLNIEEANETDIDLISETSTIGTYTVSPFSGGSS
jgi:hypothetical protein